MQKISFSSDSFSHTSNNAKGPSHENAGVYQTGSQGNTRFLEWLDPDVALKIFTCLDDSADLVRAYAVSRYWQKIVVSNGLSKQLCMRTFPELSIVTCVVEPSHDNSGKRDHRAYASLFRAITAFPLTNCIANPVSASSTDRYPAERIWNTMVPINSGLHRAYYWSSKGSNDPEKPETLIYSLTANFCVITEIKLHPFQDLSGVGPVFSSRFVRFRMGHPKSWKELNYDFIEAQECADDKFIWTYTSPLFPVAQENRLQRFKLPAPVLCIGGYLQIELAGRVNKDLVDGKYYLAVARVQATGRKLSPPFGVEFSESSDDVHLKFDAEEFVSILSTCGSISQIQPHH